MDIEMNTKFYLNQFLSKNFCWDSSAAVRTSKEKYNIAIDSEIQDGTTGWHLPSYAGIASHPKLKNISNEELQFILGTQLLEFVLKTTRFELQYVNNVCSRIGLGTCSFNFSEELKLHAIQIYTDEGYHAYFSEKIAQQIIRYYKIDSDLSCYLDNFFAKLTTFCSSEDNYVSELSYFALVIVSESMIVNDISNVMSNVVFDPIRQMLRNHMKDESMHCSYFLAIFEEIWAQLSPTSRLLFNKLLCDAMIILGRPRTDIYYFSLDALGFKSKEIATMISETYETKIWMKDRLKERMKILLNAMHRYDVSPPQQLSAEGQES